MPAIDFLPTKISHACAAVDGSIWYSDWEIKSNSFGQAVGARTFSISADGTTTKISKHSTIVAPVSATRGWLTDATGAISDVRDPSSIDQVPLLTSGSRCYDISVSRTGVAYISHMNFSNGQNIAVWSREAGRWEPFGGAGWNITVHEDGRPVVVQKNDPVDFFGRLIRHDGNGWVDGNKRVLDIDYAPDGALWAVGSVDNDQAVELLVSQDHGETFSKVNDEKYKHVRGVYAVSRNTVVLKYASSETDKITV